LFHQLFQKIEINKSLKFSAQLKRVTKLGLHCKISNFTIEVKVPKPQKKFKVKLKVKSKTRKKGISFVFSLVFTALLFISRGIAIKSGLGGTKSAPKNFFCTPPPNFGILGGT